MHKSWIDDEGWGHVLRTNWTQVPVASRQSFGALDPYGLKREPTGSPEPCVAVAQSRSDRPRSGRGRITWKLSDRVGSVSAE